MNQLTLVCALAMLINQSNLPLNKSDYSSMKSFIKRDRCKANFPDLPCLKKYVKLGYKNYYALCGKKEMLSEQKR